MGFIKDLLKFGASGPVGQTIVTAKATNRALETSLASKSTPAETDPVKATQPQSAETATTSPYQRSALSLDMLDAHWSQTAVDAPPAKRAARKSEESATVARLTALQEMIAALLADLSAKRAAGSPDAAAA